MITILNHFNFKRIDDNCYLVTNDFGSYLFLSKDEFRSITKHEKDISSDLSGKMHEGLFLIEQADLFSEEVAYRLRNMKNYVFTATSLHIFVVTNSCNLRCEYCQAQAGEITNDGMMSLETGKRAVDIALSSPSQHLTFEFQGGEPLINFPVIKGIIDYAEEIKGGKIIQYTIVTNLVLASDEILDYLIDHNVSISTSLDGNRDIHNHNRRHRNPHISSYDYVIAGVEKIRNKGYVVGAIQTTTRYSLDYPKEIVREYLNMGMPGVFIRPLTPLGFAKNEWKQIGYTAKEFLDFYRKAFEEILKINKEGSYFPEQHSVYFLKKILHNSSYNYMELRSPCGAVLGQLAYYYDGNIYTCDEARMVAEAGNQAFLLGNVYDSTYESIVSSNVCTGVCAASITESLPGCSDCVYQPYCGVCPVVNFAAGNDIFPRAGREYRCEIYSGILDYLFELIRQNDEETMKILHSWIETGDNDENC